MADLSFALQYVGRIYRLLGSGQRAGLGPAAGGADYGVKAGEVGRYGGFMLQLDTLLVNGSD